MQETANGKKDELLPVSGLSYDRVISRRRSIISQSFVIPSVSALPMQTLRQSWGVMSNASHLQSSTHVKKIVTHLPSALSIFHRIVLVGPGEMLPQLSWRCLTSTMSLRRRTLSYLQLLLSTIGWVSLVH